MPATVPCDHHAATCQNAVQITETRSNWYGADLANQKHSERSKYTIVKPWLSSLQITNQIHQAITTASANEKITELAPYAAKNNQNYEFTIKWPQIPKVQILNFSNYPGDPQGRPASPCKCNPKVPSKTSLVPSLVPENAVKHAVKHAVKVRS